MTTVSNLHAGQCVFLIAVFSIVGCGGGDDQTAPAPAVAPPKAAPAAVQIAKPKPARKAQPAAVAKAKPEAVDPNTMNVNQPNFRIVGQAPTSEEASLFAVTKPAEPAAGDVFQVVSRPAANLGQAKAELELPEDFTPLPEYGYAADGYPKRIRCDLDDSEMAYVPGGVCVLGIDGEGTDVGPQISCFVESFYMDIHEVTLGQYRAMRTRLKEEKKRTPPPAVNDQMTDDYPALGLHWGEARNYARNHGKDLPREAEWEKAARGPQGYVRPWGSSRPVWHTARTRETISQIHSYPNDVSPYGIFDLAGNAREWCYDFYSDTSWEQALKTSNDVPRNWTGPKVASRRNHRVLKGNGPGWYAWHRGSQMQSEHHPTTGFRCVLRIEPAAEDDEKERETVSRN